MFGYVKAFRPQMRIHEYETYRAVYCGLCRQLGKLYGPLARFALSYDFTFLSLLAMAVDENPPAFESAVCPANPLKRCSVAVSDSAQSFSADCVVTMLHYKVLDDLHDHGFVSRLKACILFPLTHFAHRKAKRRNGELERIIRECVQRQSQLEREGCTSVDLICDPTASCLGAICAMLGSDESQARILERLGYLMGRYVYLCDALDDIEDDERKNNYNPFILNQKADFDKSSFAVGTLYMTIGEIAKTYELLTIYKYDEILANIIYLGLKKTVDQIALKRRPESNE